MYSAESQKDLAGNASIISKNSKLHARESCNPAAAATEAFTTTHHLNNDINGCD